MTRPAQGAAARGLFFMGQVMTASVSVRVQGSTANLGSGFDCVGIAVDRAIRVVARRGDSPGPIQMVRRGALEGLDIPPDQDLVYVGFSRACKAAGSEAPQGLTLEVASDIPVARGLGSSAAAVVAGAVAARALLSLALDDAALASLCAEVEGHADNVAPSVWGGAMLVLKGDDRQILFTPLEVHPSLVLTFAIPDFQVSTERARAVLPANVPHRTAVVAAGKSAALVQGLARGDAALLAAGLDDVLHVPYRRALIRGYDDVVAAAKGAGAYGATLSGSGSTLVAVAPVDAAAAVERAMAHVWRALGVTVDTFRLPRPAGRYEVS
ncbi:MAG TPA: homoserine kinase [Gemmatimonadales bacterium]|nr:homoserine kinase [Gemmatimonadales bacterium]